MRSINLTEEDERYFAIAEDARDHILVMPMLSAFRVVAVFAYEDHEGKHHHVVGGNCECANIGAALCAERSAICQLQLLPARRVRAVYLVSDASVCITPGTLCREFLSASPLFTPQTPFIMRASDDEPRVATLAELYPFPSIYSKVNRAEVLTAGAAFCRQIEASVEEEVDEVEKVEEEEKENSGVSATQMSRFILSQCRLLEQQTQERTAYLAAIRATAKDNRDDLFALRSAAAVVFSDGVMRVAWQHKTLEYGSSLDAVSKLIPFIEARMADDASIRPVLIVQVDQFGILHAPMARARAYLHEYAFSDVTILVHDEDARLHRVAVRDLIFESPDCIAASMTSSCA